MAVPWLRRKAIGICRNKYYAAFIDFVVLVNAAAIGVEVDYSRDGLYALRIAIAGSGIIELTLRFLADRFNSCFRLLLNLADTAIWVLLVIDIMRDEYTWFWRASLLRMLRYLRVYNQAEKRPVLADLWFIFAGLARALRPLGWLALLLAVILFSSAALATGLIGANIEPHPTCTDKDPRTCFNAYEYFGSVPRSMLTLLQVATLDNWASHIARPLYDSQRHSAVLLLVFAITSAYGILSIAVGVLVHSTVELARARGGTQYMQEVKRDAETIRLLGDYFATILAVEDMDTLGVKDLAEAMLVPQISTAFKELNLPVKGIQELFHHLDKKRIGRISVDELELGLSQMKKPADRFDIACLSATIGGSCTYMERIENRAVIAERKLIVLKATLHSAFADLEQLHVPGGQFSEMPELILRKAGRIENGDGIPTMDDIPNSRRS